MILIYRLANMNPGLCQGSCFAVSFLAEGLYWYFPHRSSQKLVLFCMMTALIKPFALLCLTRSFRGAFNGVPQCQMEEHCTLTDQYVL